VSVSTAPVVRAALIAALDARSGLDGVLVTHFWQGQADEQEALYLGSTSSDEEWVTLRAGRKAREETYRIQIHIRAWKPGFWDATNETRIFALIAEVDNLLADDPAIGLSATLPTLRILLASYEVKPVALDPAGIGAEATLSLEVHSRLT